MIHNKTLNLILILPSFILVVIFSSCTKNPLPPDIIVPEGFEVEVAAGPDLVDYPMFVTIDESGRLFVFESTGNVYEKSQEAIDSPQFRINLLVDTNDDGKYDKSTIFADKVGFPQGGVFHEGSLYASSAPDLLKLTDTDNDGVADKREVILSGWVLNVNANSLIGPWMSPDGWLYMTSAIEGFDVKTKEGQQLTGETARIWRVRPDGSDLQWISAGGMNNPVGLTFTSSGEVLGTMTYFTDPRAGYRDAIMHWTEGGVYPKPNSNITRDKLPLTGELMPVVTKYSRVAPVGICRYRSEIFGKDFYNDLFSTQFNTHRVLRHKLIRDGASFRTEDEVFFSKDNEDFHPTDVQEDADGSLLVVETGGWFIKGCPLSSVSKPELEGSIYRVRKKNAPGVEDAYGKSINWASLTTVEVVARLADPRPFVSDQAARKVITKEGAVSTLINLYKTSKEELVRTRAIFALYRVNTTESIEAARMGLSDPSSEVRIAAARVAGLAKDKGAGNQLIRNLRTDDGPGRRQAATALGQIGSPEAITDLLNSATEVNDRFVQHAITYALIQLNNPSLTKQGLENPSSQVKRIALIALDQMTESTLTAEITSAYLTSPDSIMRSTALWVVTHHPEWGRSMITYLGTRLNKSNLTSQEQQQLKDILISYCRNPDMQMFVANQMKTGSNDKKLFLLETIAEASIKEFPSAWTTMLAKEISSSADANVKLKALNLVQLHHLTSVTESVEQITMDEKNPANVRLAAIGTIVNDSTELSNDHFKFLVFQLQPDNSAPTRHLAASVLSRSRLSDEQLKLLARDFLPNADALILPRILPVFKHGHDLQVGNALTATLLKTPTLDNFTEEYLRDIFKGYPAELNTSVEQLIAKLNEVRAERLNRIHEIEKNITSGDIEKGRLVFFGKAICSTCHTIGMEGEDFGPDLTSIQRDRSAHDLVEAIVYPSVSFVREYETYKISTAQNNYTGIIEEQNSEFILLKISPQESVRIASNEITSIQVHDVSMMPQGLDKMLTDQELADLMAFLVGQDQDPETDSQLLR